MSEKELRKHVSGLPLGGIRYFDSIGSTNDDAMAWAASGAPDFSLVAADEQTAGRGRQGRAWFTPAGSALAVSLILRPQHGREREHVGLFSGLGALALLDSLKIIGLHAEIKWPNDVLVNHRKVAGLLVETVWLGNEVESVVLGMGVNVLSTAVPPGAALNFPAASLQDALQHPLERFELLRYWLTSFQRWRPKLGTPEFIAAWEENLAFRNEQVQVWASDSEHFTGWVDRLEADGSLRVRLESGEVRSLRVGEIHLRPV